jgi:ribosomal-protein-alanine N-acetyltransferase
VLQLQIVPLTKVHALDIFRWRYPVPYDFYDPPDSVDPALFLDPDVQFHSLLDSNLAFIGFCSFGPDGQVSGGDYSVPALDIGLGMKPSLTGQGHGDAFFKVILNFAIKSYECDLIRLTVADFNQRAMILYKKVGFKERQNFINPNNAMPYTVLTLNIRS